MPFTRSETNRTLWAARQIQSYAFHTQSLAWEKKLNGWRGEAMEGFEEEKTSLNGRKTHRLEMERISNGYQILATFETPSQPN